MKNAYEFELSWIRWNHGSGAARAMSWYGISPLGHGIRVALWD